MAAKARAHEGYQRPIIIFSLVFFLAWGFYDLATRNYHFIADRFLDAGISLAALLLYRRMHLTTPTLLVGAVPLILHSLGLYTESYFGIPFDAILHFTAGLAIAMVLSQFLLNERMPYPRAFFFAVCATAGLGSFLEIVEWLGYIYLGEGGGILFYGAGDHGGWDNAVADMICNTAGAVCGFVAALVQFRR